MPTIQGLTKLLKDIDRIADRNTPGRSVLNSIDKLLYGAAYDCAAIARNEYAKAAARGVEGADEITVPTPRIKDGTAVVSAIGERILFVEFGTGINTNYGSSSRVAGEYGFTPASWSAQHKQWLVPPKSVVYKGWWVTPDGRETEGHPPVDAMYHAFEQMLARLHDREKAVFK